MTKLFTMLDNISSKTDMNVDDILKSLDDMIVSIQGTGTTAPATDTTQTITNQIMTKLNYVVVALFKKIDTMAAVHFVDSSLGMYPIELLFELMKFEDLTEADLMTTLKAVDQRFGSFGGVADLANTLIGEIYERDVSGHRNLLLAPQNKKASSLSPKQARATGLTGSRPSKERHCALRFAVSGAGAKSKPRESSCLPKR
jgi:hypothetical protein